MLNIMNAHRRRIGIGHTTAFWLAYSAICGLIAALSYVVGGSLQVIGHTFVVALVTAALIGGLCALVNLARWGFHTLASVVKA